MKGREATSRHDHTRMSLACRIALELANQLGSRDVWRPQVTVSRRHAHKLLPRHPYRVSDSLLSPVLQVNSSPPAPPSV